MALMRSAAAIRGVQTLKTIGLRSTIASAPLKKLTLSSVLKRLPQVTMKAGMKAAPIAAAAAAAAAAPAAAGAPMPVLIAQPAYAAAAPTSFAPAAPATDGASVEQPAGSPGMPGWVFPALIVGGAIWFFSRRRR